jgi:hypothetical protein
MVDHSTVEDYMTTARKRFEAARLGWQEIRRQATEDMKAVNVRGGQWDKAVASARNNAGRPALEFNELHIYVQQITNRARQERPQPRITPGDQQASVPVAEFLESKIRQIHYESQADVAYDCAVEACASGGIGWFRITTEYTDDQTLNQEPRIRRILDPMTVYPDPSAMEADFSDMKWCFVRQRMKRDEFKSKFGIEPIEFDKGSASEDWNTEEDIWVAEYWRLEERYRTLLFFDDGTKSYSDELPEEEWRGEPIGEREVCEKTVVCDLIDGSRKLESTEWIGDWIPLIPVCGKEVVVEGKRYFLSAVRFAIDSQKLKNSYKSGIADSIQSATLAPWIGVKGQFKSSKWKDAHLVKYATLEYEDVSLKSGQPAAPPSRNAWEAPIQALSVAAMQESENIRKSIGYVDNVQQQSSTPLSGVAVQRRTAQADLTNWHFQDNLIRSQWHSARILVQLIVRLIDTPRAERIRHEDGETATVPVNTSKGGYAPGYEGKPHLQIDKGNYGVTIVTGPSYASKREEEKEVLLQILQTAPGAWQLYADRIFNLMGYPDLEARAKLTLPPQIQQAIAAEKGEGGQTPQMIQAQAMQLSQENQQLKQVLTALAQKLQSKAIEGQNKLEVERLKLMGQMILQQMAQSGDHAGMVLQQETGAIQHVLDIVHAHEMADKQFDQQSQQQAQSAADAAAQQQAKQEHELAAQRQQAKVQPV